MGRGDKPEPSAWELRRGDLERAVSGSLAWDHFLRNDLENNPVFRFMIFQDRRKHRVPMPWRFPAKYSIIVSMTIFDLLFIGFIIRSLPLLKFHQTAIGVILLFGVHILHDHFLKYYIRKSAKSVDEYKYRFGNLPGKLLNELMLTAIDHEDFIRGYLGFLHARSRRKINQLCYIEILLILLLIFISWINPFWWALSMIVAVSLSMWIQIIIHKIKNPIITCYQAALSLCQATVKEKIEDPLIIRAGCGTQVSVLSGVLFIMLISLSLSQEFEAAFPDYLIRLISIIAGVMCGALLGFNRFDQSAHFNQYLGDALGYMRTALDNLHGTDRDELTARRRGSA